MHGKIIDYNVKDNISSGELNIEYCDEDNVHKVLCLLERKIETQVDNMKELTEEEFSIFVKYSKRRSTSSIF